MWLWGLLAKDLHQCSSFIIKWFCGPVPVAVAVPVPGPVVAEIRKTASCGRRLVRSVMCIVTQRNEMPHAVMCWGNFQVDMQIHSYKWYSVFIKYLWRSLCCTCLVGIDPLLPSPCCVHTILRRTLPRFNIYWGPWAKHQKFIVAKWGNFSTICLICLKLHHYIPKLVKTIQRSCTHEPLARYFHHLC